VVAAATGPPPPGDQRSFRRKQDEFGYLVNFGLGYGAGGLRTPKGLLQGQNLELALTELVPEGHALASFDELPIPFRAIAVDLDDGREVVLAAGNLARAMRASMSLPGIFTPAVIDGRELLDGGLVRNVPIEEARALGADRLIVVDIGTPVAVEGISSALGVSTQMVQILTQQNVDRSLAGIRAGDVLIRPQLGEITSSDFDRAAESIEVGERAARAEIEHLRSLSAPPAVFERFLARQRREEPAIVVATIAVEDDTGLGTAAILGQVRARAGEVLDLTQLRDDVERIFGLGHFSRVGYQLLPSRDGTWQLVVQAEGKSWGPTLIRFGVELSSDLQGSSSFNLGGQATRLAINEAGGEWRVDVQAGEVTRIGTELYQPLSAGGSLFVAPRATWAVTDLESEIGTLDVRAASAGLDLGSALGTWGELRVGYTRLDGEVDADRTIVPVSGFDFDDATVSATFLFDTTDDADFPHSGTRGGVSYSLADDALGADADYQQLRLASAGFFSVGRTTAAVALRYETALDEPLPLYRTSCSVASRASRDSSPRRSPGNTSVSSKRWCATGSPDGKPMRSGSRSTSAGRSRWATPGTTATRCGGACRWRAASSWRSTRRSDRPTSPMGSRKAARTRSICSSARSSSEPRSRPATLRVGTRRPASAAGRGGWRLRLPTPLGVPARPVPLGSRPPKWRGFAYHRGAPGLALPSPLTNMLARILTLGILTIGNVLAQDVTDAQHYKLEIELDFSTHTITGANTATFKSTVANLASIDLDLTSSLTVSGVQMNAANVPFSRNGDRLTITLDRAYQPDEQFTVVVAYAGAPAGGGFGGFQWVTHGTPSAEMAWTLSEPWYAYTWWPVKETLTDKSTSEVWITHPDTMAAASNGRRLGIDTLSGNRLRTRWQTTYQIAPYLISLAVTNYQTRTDTYTGLGANMPVEFFVFPESYASWQPGLDRIVPMLSAFSGVYGQYPFVQEKYGIAQFTWGGGMEHQTITSQSSASEYLCAHELSHHWWGDNVTCASWHDIWLNEGFATFSEAVWAERRSGGTLAAYLSKIRQTRPSQTSGTVYVYNITNINNVFSTNYVYNKGSWVLHQLRHVLGDATFFQALLDYRAAYTGRSATTADFRASCEQTSGRDLGWFFDQWVMNGGSPTYRHAGRFLTRNGRNYLYLQVTQTQTTPNTTIMPLDVVVQTGSGAVTQAVWDDERGDQFVIELPAAGSSYALDPDQWVLRSLSTGTYAAPFFAADAETIDVAAGGASGLHLDLGVGNAGRPYLIVCGLSGTTPGTNVFGLQVPVNFDLMTNVALGLVNTPVFQSFFATLDAQGLGDATLALPAGVGVPMRGADLACAAVLVDHFDFASRPVNIALR